MAFISHIATHFPHAAKWTTLSNHHRTVTVTTAAAPGSQTCETSASSTALWEPENNNNNIFGSRQKIKTHQNRGPFFKKLI